MPSTLGVRMNDLTARLAAQLRECAETLGADKIDEHRAMRAFADSMELLEEMTHISSIEAANVSLLEQK